MPADAVTYVDAHDNQTPFDALTYKLPSGTAMADRVRSQNRDAPGVLAMHVRDVDDRDPGGRVGRFGRVGPASRCTSVVHRLCTPGRGQRGNPLIVKEKCPHWSTYPSRSLLAAPVDAGDVAGRLCRSTWPKWLSVRRYPA